MDKASLHTPHRVKHVGLDGPSCSGKGFVTAHLCKVFGDSLYVIGLGDMIRERKQRDQEFAVNIREKTSNGKLLDYDIVTPMVIERYRLGLEKGYKFFLWEGYGRDHRQMTTLLNEIWSKDDESRIYMLAASLKTCQANLAKAIAEGRRSERDDNGQLPGRYQLHRDNDSGVRKAIKESGRCCNTIDADVPLLTVARQIALRVRLMKNSDPQVAIAA